MGGDCRASRGMGSVSSYHTDAGVSRVGRLGK